MTWRRQTNFHNSRRYDDEARTGGVVSQPRLILAWLIDNARRKFRSMTKPVPAQQRDMIVVKLGDGRGFTVLGSAIMHHAVHESAMTCPSPSRTKHRHGGGPRNVQPPAGSSIRNADPRRIRRRLQADTEMLAQTAFDARVVRIDAIRACGPLSEPSDRSARAAERITALGEMTRGIAHDFRNVLCMLTSGLNIAEASIDEPDKLKLALDAMHDGIARGLRVTNQLLDSRVSRNSRLGPTTSTRCWRQ